MLVFESLFLSMFDLITIIIKIVAVIKNKNYHTDIQKDSTERLDFLTAELNATQNKSLLVPKR